MGQNVSRECKLYVLKSGVTSSTRAIYAVFEPFLVCVANSTQGGRVRAESAAYLIVVVQVGSVHRRNPLSTPVIDYEEHEYERLRTTT